jgi:hypothetical protein
MTTTLAVIWWIGLLGALVATLVILKEVFLVLRALRDIHRLAVATRQAGAGVAVNVRPIPDLAPLPARARRLVAAHGALRAASAALERFRPGDEPRREAH